MRRKVTGIAAAILAGGKNSRMKGRNKALLRINGVPLIERAVKLLKEIFEEVIIVTNSTQDFKSYKKDAIIIEDIIKGAGPLGGMHSALSRMSKEAVFFAACDMPFLHNDIIRLEVSSFSKTDCDCLVPKIGALIEPICAVYKKNLKDKIETFLKHGDDFSIRGFLKTVNTHYLDLGGNIYYRNAFKNLNTSEDFEKEAKRHGDKIQGLA